MEAQLCGGEEVIVVGGGNSAGQAAVFLAQTARHVHMLVRGEAWPNDVALPDPPHRGEPDHRAAHAHGDRRRSKANDHLERVRWRDNATGAIETHDIRHVFVMTGAVPNTTWLDGCVALDAKGFIKTGPDLTRDDLVSGEVAADPRAASARDEPARRLRRRRRPRRQHQARGVGGRRRIDRRLVRPPGAARVSAIVAIALRASLRNLIGATRDR